MLERVESWWRGFEWRLLNTKEVRSCNKLLKFWIAGVTDEFSSETLILRKRLSSFYTKCIQFLPWPSLLFCTCYAREMMIPCQVSTFSEFICRAFQFQGHLAQKKSLMREKQKIMSETVESWWCGFEWCILNAKDVQSCNKLLKFWIADVTDEFSFETLILRKRLSSLYTKCVQFLPWPSLLFCTCYAGEMMIPCQVSTFLEFICSAFQFQSFSSKQISKCIKNSKLC